MQESCQSGVVDVLIDSWFGHRRDRPMSGGGMEGSSIAQASHGPWYVGPVREQRVEPVILGITWAVAYCAGAETVLALMIQEARHVDG